jgi:hypothetical protein
MDWKTQPETQEPDPELAAAVEAAGRVAAVVDEATAWVAPGIRLIAFAGLVGVLAARTGTGLDSVLNLVRDFHAQELDRIRTRGH